MCTRLVSLLVVTLLVASGCGSPTTPLPIQSPSESVPTPATSASAPTPGSTVLSPSPVAVGHWEAAGQLALGRLIPKVMPLANHRALVIGNDVAHYGDCPLGDCYPCVRDDTTWAEIWDLGNNGWRDAPGLNKPRAEFAAVTLPDGRVLVAGGINAGVGDESGPYTNQSYSSVYLYGPDSDGTEIWSRAGLLGTPRTAPSAATLPDGRVLVAGGYYVDPSSNAGAPSAAGSARPTDAGLKIPFLRRPRSSTPRPGNGPRPVRCTSHASVLRRRRWRMGG